MKKITAAEEEVMKARFGHDALIALATVENGLPNVRTVNGYYEGGAFYVVTHALSNKMKQIALNPAAAVCGEWFSAHGLGENRGWVRDPKNKDIAETLRSVFAAWYGNGHVDEDDTNTCILRIRLTDGVLFSHGARYDLDFGPD